MSHVLFDWKIGALFNQKNDTYKWSYKHKQTKLNMGPQRAFYFSFRVRIPQRALIALALRFSCAKHT